MNVLQAEDLLSAWEQGLNQPLLQRVLILLVTAFPEMQPDTLVKLSIGQRDRRLLRLRECLFGQRLLNSAKCPKCELRIEWENNTADFIEHADEGVGADDMSVNEFDLHVDDYALRLRLPNSLDIASLVNPVDKQPSLEKMQQQLLSRCLLKIEYCGTACDVNQLPETVIQKVNQHIERLDPQADIRIQLDCPECSHRWDVLFDIASFLWVEVNDWAEKMLQTVHTLAAGYGWSEREILKLSPVRRRLYLGMLES